MKSQIPYLEYPFELKISPHGESLEQKSVLWIDKYTCLPESLRRRYKKSNFGKFIASFFSNASPELLTITSKWILAAFAFDDLYGSLPLDELKKECQKVIDLSKDNSFHFVEEQKDIILKCNNYIQLLNI